MEALRYLGMGAFVAVSAAVGVRLLWLAGKRHAAPELLIGAGLLLMGAVGPGVVTWGSTVASSHPEWIPTTWGGGLLAIDLGAAALFAFTYRVFYAGTPRGMLIAAGGIGMLIVTWVGQARLTGFETMGIADPFGYAGLGTRICAMSWACQSALAEYEMARKRVVLGLADPVVANRFLLWSIGSGCASLVFLVNLFRNLTGNYSPDSFFALAVTPALGLTAAIAIALAFMPPAAYVRAISRAPEPAR